MYNRGRNRSAPDCICRPPLQTSVDITVLDRSTPHRILEQAREVSRILESQVVGYLAYRTAAVEDSLLGGIYQPQTYVFLGRMSGLPLYEVTEIVGRKVQLSGAVLNRRQTYGLRLVRIEVIVEQALEA